MRMLAVALLAVGLSLPVNATAQSDDTFLNDAMNAFDEAQAHRLSLFGDQAWVGNPGARRASPSEGHIATLGAIQSRIRPEGRTFVMEPFGLRLATAFDRCRLALVSNRNMASGFRSSYVCDPEWEVGYLTLTATASSSEASSSQVLLVFAQHQSERDAAYIAGLAPVRQMCAEWQGPAFARAAAACEFEFEHYSAEGVRPGIYRKYYIAGDNVLISITTACAGDQCQTTRPVAEQFARSLTLDARSN